MRCRRPQQHRRQPSRRKDRSGLAPLELVLSLPLLLFVMALMVNFTVMASWKVRGLTAARQSIFRDRMFWSAGGDPNSPNWPSNAAMRTGTPNPALLSSNTVNAWELNPKIIQDFVQAPFVTVNGNAGPYIQILEHRSLYMVDGLRQGESELTRNLPMLPRLNGYQNGYHMQPNHPLLDNRWQFGNINLRDNHSRRLLDWYNFDDRPDWSSQRSQYLAADAAIQGYSRQNDLLLLDRDPELAAFDGNPRHDFYPRVRGCDIDPQRVHDTLIVPTDLRSTNGLVDRIQGRWPRNIDTDGDGRIDTRIPGVSGVAVNVARRFISMYNAQKALLQAMLPPPQPQIDDLQQRIDQLNEFINTVPH
ncbi:MAG: hypothetical protein HZA46_01575 [Planctomycetales bacterium]|nr:hypothetical protein [Planctomycetales bacterium]